MAEEFSPYERYVGPVDRGGEEVPVSTFVGVRLFFLKSAENRGLAEEIIKSVNILASNSPTLYFATLGEEYRRRSRKDASW